MCAELEAIDDPADRRRFASGAALAAARVGIGFRLVVALATALAIVAVAVSASRIQLADGGPGVLPITVPVPALLLLLAAAISALRDRSFTLGLQAGVIALVLGFAGLCAVLAVEGMVWMERHGVFLLDGDPPRSPAGPVTVALDIFTTGMWVGHAIFWVPAVVVGAALGVVLAGRQPPGTAGADRDAGH